MRSEPLRQSKKQPPLSSANSSTSLSNESGIKYSDTDIATLYATTKTLQTETKRLVQSNDSILNFVFIGFIALLILMLFEFTNAYNQKEKELREILSEVYIIKGRQTELDINNKLSDEIQRLRFEICSLNASSSVCI